MAEKIILDGKEITAKELHEAQQNKAVRIVEDKKNPGTFKTLKKLNG